jgi:hypothetical protein
LISEEAGSTLAQAIETFERLSARADLDAAWELEGRFV